MNITLINAFLSGANALGFAVIALLFYSFWRRSGTALFGIFTVAFSLLSLERLVLLLIEEQNEFAPFAYLIRLTAFLVIVVGVINHNRQIK